MNKIEQSSNKVGLLDSYDKTLRKTAPERVIRIYSAYLKQAVETGGNADMALSGELASIEEQLSASAGEIAQLISSVRTLENDTEALLKEIEDLSENYAEIEERKENKEK